MRPPEILDIVVDGESHEPGSVIKIKAIDDFRVSKVFVALYGTDGMLLDEGEADLNGKDSNWVYVSNRAPASLTGCRLVAIATDTPGNNATRDIVL
jgi:hypothetical protein